MRQSGWILPLAIILLAAGTLMVVTLLPYLSTMLHKSGSEREQTMKRYACEAAINRVMADLIRGADAVSTTYITTSPHKVKPRRPWKHYETFTITTNYTAPSITINDYTPTLEISLPTAGQEKPSDQQNYVDPGVTHPDLAVVEAHHGYLMRLYNVKAGTLQINWAYSPKGQTIIGVWAGMPVDRRTGEPYPAGEIDRWPAGHPLAISMAGFRDSHNLTRPLSVDPDTDDSGGVYTIVFYNSNGRAKTTAPFRPSGSTDDTWIYVKAYKDYIITATIDGISVSAYVRQVPGFSEPPAVEYVGSNATKDYVANWATDNVSFITSEVYVYTWLSP